MSYNFLAEFDGTGRAPRDVQVTALEWLSKNWFSSRIKVLKAPVGSGKSAVAKAIQRATGASIITPSNGLIQQYQDTYPKDNFLKGKVHYSCGMGVTCHDWTTLLEQKACEQCPYKACKDAAAAGAPTVYNPMSLYYFLLGNEVLQRVTIVDEAHQLASFIATICSKRFRRRDYNWPRNIVNEVRIIEWLAELQAQLIELVRTYKDGGDNKNASKASEELSQVSIVLKSMREDPTNFAIWTTKEARDEYLNIKPIRPPRSVVDRILGRGHIVLMSGTIFDHDVSDLCGSEKYASLDLPSPIPAAQRPILFRPMGFPVNKDTPIEKIAASVDTQMKTLPGPIMVHTTYSKAPGLSEALDTPSFFNDRLSKESSIQRFKTEGGAFVAAGCAEGLDLPGDLCRLNIIPKLNYPDLSDPAVKRRRGEADGETWYMLETLKQTIQQSGRSTRHEADWSNTVVMDPQFSRYVNKCYKHLPKYFTDAIRWDGKGEVRG